MKKELEDAWDEAERTGKAISIGRMVVCDVCNKDYTDLPDQGGFIFGSYAYCRACGEKHMPWIIADNEQRYIRAVCAEGESFADFVRRYRGPEGGMIKITRMGCA